MDVIAAQPDPELALAALTAAVACLALVLLWTGLALRRRERAVSEMRAYAERLALALDASEMGTFDGDLVQHRFRWSKYHELLFGYGEGEYDGTREGFRDRLHPEDRARVIQELADARASRQPYMIEARTLWPDGTVRWVQARGRHYYDERGRAVRVLGTVVDVTERRRAEDELRRTKAAADAASAAKSAFLTAMSHELRTPLSVIIGFADLLASDMGLPAQARIAGSRIKMNGLHQLSLVDDVLDLAKVEADQLEIERVPFHLDAVLTDVAAMLQPKAAEKGVMLSVAGPPSPSPAVIGDARRVRQILVHIVGNAVKFTAPGGVVQVEATLEPVPGARGLRRVQIDVVDDGIGIDAAQHQRIFDPFVQGDPSLSRAFGGVGLGLHLARRLARLLGGEIELKWSEPGLGSKFVLVFDAREERAAPPDGDAART